jgi:hypothetical protein
VNIIWKLMLDEGVVGQLSAQSVASSSSTLNSVEDERQSVVMIVPYM